MDETNITMQEAMTEQESGSGEALAPVQENEQIASLEEAISQIASETDTSPDTSDDADDSAPAEAPQGRKQTLKERFDSVSKKGYEQGRDDALKEAEERWSKERASYEQRLARLEEIELKDRAKDLAKELGITEAAAEYIAKMEKRLSDATGTAPEMPKSEKSATPQRDASGRFVSQKQTAATAEPSEQQYRERAQALLTEAQQIQQSTGLDMLELFRTNEVFRGQIARGETTFAAAAAAIQAYSGRATVPDTQSDVQRTPRVVRETGASNNPASTLSISNMGDDQFERLDRSLARGGRYRAK